MKTTLILDEDVHDRVRKVASRLNKPIKTVVNEALRAGLNALDEKRVAPRPYHTDARPLGLRKGCSLDNVQELLAQVEGEEAFAR